MNGPVTTLPDATNAATNGGVAMLSTPLVACLQTCNRSRAAVPISTQSFLFLLSQGRLFSEFICRNLLCEGGLDSGRYSRISFRLPSHLDRRAHHPLVGREVGWRYPRVAAEGACTMNVRSLPSRARQDIGSSLIRSLVLPGRGAPRSCGRSIRAIAAEMVEFRSFLVLRTGRLCRAVLCRTGQHPD